MRILLTGATGQVGAALVAPLSDFGTILAPPRSEFDLAQPEKCVDQLDVMLPDLIINPAAYTAVDRAEDEPELAYRINAEAPRVMAEWAARRSVPLIHFSTDYVFDGSGHLPRSEADPAAPLSVYGMSKFGGEKAVRAAGGPSLVLRTSWVYANHGRNFMLTIARLAAEREELRIVSDQIGAPTSARAIADAVVKIIQCGGLRKRACETVNLACGGETSWCGFADAIISGLRKRDLPVRAKCVMPIMSEEYPTKAIRPRNSRLDLTKLARLFAITMPSWQASLDTELDALAEFQAASIAPSLEADALPAGERTSQVPTIEHRENALPS